MAMAAAKSGSVDIMPEVFPARILGTKSKFFTDSQDYLEHRQHNALYVDKTLFIKDFMTDDCKTALITRPRRFGKSLLMSMVKNFLSHSIKDTDFHTMFDDTLISDDKEFFEAHQRQYFVIHMDFKDLAKAENAADAIERFKKKIRHMIGDLVPFLNISGVSLSTRLNMLLTDLNSIIADEKLEVSNPTYIDALNNLIHVLHALYVATGKLKGIVVLIDDCDAPLVSAYRKNIRDSAFNLHTAVLGAFKGGTSYAKVLFTGVLRISNYSLLSVLNNISAYDIFSDQYRQYFGFTEAEMELVFNKIELNDEGDRKQIKAWYNGYSVGGRLPVQMYNPWSVASCLNTKPFSLANYCKGSGSTELIQQALKAADFTAIRADILELFAFAKKRIVLPTTHVEKLRPTCDITFDYVRRQFDLGEIDTNSDMFWKLMIHTGYVTGELIDPSRCDCQVYRLRIANKELECEYAEGLIQHYFRETHILRENSAFEILKSCGDDCIKNAYIDLSRICKEVPSYIYWNNQSFHCTLLGLAASVLNMHEIESYHEYGSDYSDIILKFPDRGTAYLFELKYVLGDAREKGKAIRDRLIEALEQIKEKHYDRFITRTEGITRLITIGLVYCAKELTMVYQDNTISFDGAGVPRLKAQGDLMMLLNGDRETQHLTWDVRYPTSSAAASAGAGSLTAAATAMPFMSSAGMSAAGPSVEPTKEFSTVLRKRKGREIVHEADESAKEPPDKRPNVAAPD